MERSNSNNNILRDLGLKMGYNSLTSKLASGFRWPTRLGGPNLFQKCCRNSANETQLYHGLFFRNTYGAWSNDVRNHTLRWIGGSELLHSSLSTLLTTPSNVCKPAVLLSYQKLESRFLQVNFLMQSSSATSYQKLESRFLQVNFLMQSSF